jgi:hypothetical protein
MISNSPSARMQKKLKLEIDELLFMKRGWWAGKEGKDWRDYADRGDERKKRLSKKTLKAAENQVQLDWRR